VEYEAVRTLAPLRAAALLAMTVAAGACASAPQSDADDAPTEQLAPGQSGVEVRNDMVPPLTYTVYLVQGSGPRQLLGNVSAGETALLRIRAPLIGGQYRLLGQSVTGSELLSTPFAFGGSGRVRWNMRANVTRVVRQ
jgi:hypothetical protein